MRVPLGAASVLLVFLVTLVVVQPMRAADQQPASRGVPTVTDPGVLTRIESLLAMPDVVLTTDFYHVDMRFGPNVALDAVVVTAVDLQKRLRGLRIGLREDAKPSVRSSRSFLDIEEGATLSRALASMMDVAGKWSGREDQRSTDVTFATVGGFGVGIHQVAHTQTCVLSSGFDDPVRTSIELVDLPSLKSAVDQALALLDRTSGGELPGLDAPR